MYACMLPDTAAMIEDGEAAVIEDGEARTMENVIQSEIFREELQEIVAKQISDSLQPASQPLYDLISLRQRYGQPDENQQYSTHSFFVLIIFISPIMVVQIQPNNQNKIQILN